MPEDIFSFIIGFITATIIWLGSFSIYNKGMTDYTQQYDLYKQCVKFNTQAYCFASTIGKEDADNK